ncbi:hypothetical protein AB0758_44410 [Tolypothrix bouteillei VB521301_2]|uniref:hypothetical protein n=1 Tax=Tolypothrix bouteillei TaxID=1246981 RepID=UPI0038B6109D
MNFWLHCRGIVAKPFSHLNWHSKQRPSYDSALRSQALDIQYLATPFNPIWSH